MTKLIVSDIDGTLVPDGRSGDALNPEYYDVIRELSSMGVTFAACSGRQFLSMYKVFVPVADITYFITEGGGAVFDGDRNLMYSKTLPADTVKEIVEDSMNIPQLDVMVTGLKRAYCRSRDSEMYRWMVDDYGFDIEAVGNRIVCVDDDVAKVSLYHHNKAEELAKEKFIPKWEKKIKVTIAGIQWVDCVSPESGKGNALGFLQDKLQVKPEETVAFGDNQNDIEMFERSGTSYAVANAREEVRKAASAVCDPMEEDGVLKILKEIRDDLQR